MTIPSALFAAIMATFPPCPIEDSPDCAWDAQERGNGAGTSFVNLNGTIFYEVPQ